MFLGKYEARIGNKNRLTLPSKIIKHLTKQHVVVGKGFEQTVYGYELARWKNLTKDYLSTSLLDEESRKVRRFIFSNALIVPFDKQGRIVIPAFLYEYARLSHDVYIIGAGDHFEIWDTEEWIKKEKKLSTI